MLKICLSRRGKKRRATFRLVVLDKQKDPVGNFREDFGFYDPHTKKAEFNLERVEYWVKKGAEKSESVLKLIEKFDKDKKIIKVSKKKKISRQKKEAQKKEKEEKPKEAPKEETKKETNKKGKKAPKKEARQKEKSVKKEKKEEKENVDPVVEF